MTLSALITFLIGTLVFVLVPGPSVLFIVGRALALGRRAALLTAVGNLLGVLLLVALVSIGVGAFLEAFAPALLVLKLIGGCYLIWLGWQAFRDRGQLAHGLDPNGEVPAALARPVRQGFIVGLTNPKAIVFFAAVLPQFVATGGPAIPVQIAILGLVFCLLATTVDIIWAVAAGTARQWFIGSPVRMRRIGGTGGVLIMGLGIGVLATARNPQ